MRLSLLEHGDWLGIGAMAIGLAALQTALDEGNKDGWFDSAFIMRLAQAMVMAYADTFAVLGDLLLLAAGLLLFTRRVGVLAAAAH
jgi:DHA2 family multidrug resistance protein